jgi:hypothetical protein
MELYHYTSVPLLHSILNEGISKGHFLRSNNQILYGHCWYTTSPLPHGHGLPDGTEVLTQSDKEFAQRAASGESSSSVNSLQNKKLIRIKVDYEWLEKEERFYKFSKLLQIYGESSLYSKVLGVMGWVKPATLSDSELRRWIKSPKLKHDTWFVHQGVLPVERILSIEFMEKEDNYVPYNFEIHGRPELERNGLYSISDAELDEVNNHEQHAPFLSGSVVVIFPNPKATPAIVFKKRSCALVLNIQTGAYIGSEGSIFSDEDAIRLGIWTRNHSEYLMSLWNKSKESWFRHNR